MKLKTVTRLIPAAFLAVVFAAAAQTPAPSQAPGGQALEKQLQQASTAMPGMTAEQTAKYRAEYQAAKTKWASLTPQQKQATIAAARNKKIADLSAIELVGQRDDMQQETAAQTAQVKAEAAAAKARWDKLAPAEKQALRKSAWQKKRAELDAMEAVGQRDDSYILPY